GEIASAEETIESWRGIFVELGVCVGRERETGLSIVRPKGLDSKDDIHVRNCDAHKSLSLYELYDTSPGGWNLRSLDTVPLGAYRVGTSSVSQDVLLLSRPLAFENPRTTRYCLIRMTLGVAIPGGGSRQRAPAPGSDHAYALNRGIPSCLWCSS